MKTIIIVRGLPGSGKSTQVRKMTKELERKGYSYAVCSADDYFIRGDGSYVYDSSRIREAHLYCYSKAVSAVAAKTEFVFIDNTNIKREHYQKYVKLAKDNGYSHIVITMPYEKWTDRELAERNVHGVPVETIRKMRKDLDNEA